MSDESEGNTSAIRPESENNRPQLDAGALPSPGEKAARPTAVSHSFHTDIPDSSIRRSLIAAAIASTCGMVMFGVVQGTVINFFLEDLDLKERIPWFLGLQWLAGSGSIVGSYIQERWGFRRVLMFSCCGLARLIWLFVGLLPLVFPSRIPLGHLFWPISAAFVIFYFVHSVGANAWLAWMSDLVPPKYQSRFWTFRQVGTSTSSALAQLAFGYYLEYHRNWNAYAWVFGIATLMGVIDVSLYVFVSHRHPKINPVQRGILTEPFNRLKDRPYRLLCGVYLLWLASNCIMAPTVYYFMRDHIQMGIRDISLSRAVWMVGYTVSSLFWGRLSKNEGQRRGVIACLVVQNLCTYLYFMCGPNSTYLVTAAGTLEQVGLGGVTLLMFPMLIDYTKGKGGRRAMGMAAFTVMLSFVGFGASLIADRHIYDWTSKALNVMISGADFSSASPRVMLTVMTLAFALRSASLYLAYLLPPCETQLAAGPGTMMLRRMSEGPVRAAQSIFTATVGRLGGDDESKRDSAQK